MGEAATSVRVTSILLEAQKGGPVDASELLPLVYEQLKELARARMAAERGTHTLQPTALVHEAYLRLVGNAQVTWASRAHFFHAAAEAMRRILIDHARSRGQLKRGGCRRRVPMDVLDLAADDQAGEALLVDEALDRLDLVSPSVGQVVRLRFFAGLTERETAQALGVSARTIRRDWTFARAWLFRELGYEATKAGRQQPLPRHPEDHVS